MDNNDDDGKLHNVGALVPMAIKQSIALRAKRIGVSRSDIIRFALMEYLKDELAEQYEKEAL
mgnify:CR=1 FL=1